MLTPARFALSLAVCMLLWAPDARAQNGIAAFDPEGVYIDAEGMLHPPKVPGHKRLAAIRKKAAAGKAETGLAYVSLPRLFAEAKAHIEAGKPLPPEIRYLGGITKLRYVFVYPEQKDLVIVGTAEPFDATVPFRPLGQRTGRPVLQLDDLVTALRTCGPGKTDNAFGCTIVLTADATRRLNKTQTENIKLAQRSSTRRKLANMMAEAAGAQNVHFFNMKAETRFAFVCAEADFQLKRLAVGLDRSPVAKVKSYLALQTKPEGGINRFWFLPRYDAIGVTPDGNGYDIRGPSLQVQTRRKFTDPHPANVSPVAGKFAEQFSANFDALAERTPSFADLANLADLSLLAALIGRDGLDKKAGWDMGWVTTSYPVATVDVPKTAEPLVNYRVAGRMLIFSSGGVKFDLDDAIKRREPVKAGALDTHRKRPNKTWRLSSAK